MTVSRALAGRGVAPETRSRILEAVETLHYVHDAAAGALSSGRSGFVAALVPTLANSNFADTLRGLSDGLAEAGLQVLLGYMDYCIDCERLLVRTMLRHRPEAVVLTGGDHLPATRTLLRRAGVLVAETWDLPADPLGLVSGFSNAAAAGLMVHHLAGRGYRRIGFLGGPPGHDRRGEDRRQGYLTALTECGLGPPRIVEEGMPPIAISQGAAGMARMMRQWPDTDAVFCVSDLAALGAVMTCHREGWAIPGRVAVAGFGDFEGAASCYPALTTVQVNPRMIGDRAARLLLDAIAGTPGAPRTAMLPVEIVQRESA